MTTDLAVTQGAGMQQPRILAEVMEKVVVEGDLSRLTAPERVNYYRSVCDSVGLNPLTKPFEYLRLNGKLTLYANRNCTDQLRKINHISLAIKSREVVEDCYVVTASAKDPDGRADESIGAVPINGKKGEDRANALMKCETKAKRRVTLSICGLSMLDETEIETISDAQRVPVDAETGEIVPADPPTPKPTPPEIQDTRPVPEEIQILVAGIEREPSQKNIGQALKAIEGEFARRGGADGIRLHSKMLAEYRQHVPKGKDTVVSLRSLMIDLWEAAQNFGEPFDPQEGN